MKMTGIARMGMLVVAAMVLAWGLGTPAVAGPLPGKPHSSDFLCADLDVGPLAYRFISQKGTVKKIEFYANITNKGSRDYVPGPLHTVSLKQDPAPSLNLVISQKLPGIAVGKSWHVEFVKNIDTALPANKTTLWYISLNLAADSDPAHRECNKNNNESARVAGSLITN